MRSRARTCPSADDNHWAPRHAPNDFPQILLTGNCIRDRHHHRNNNDNKTSHWILQHRNRKKRNATSGTNHTQSRTILHQSMEPIKFVYQNSESMWILIHFLVSAQKRNPSKNTMSQTGTMCTLLLTNLGRIPLHYFNINNTYTRQCLARGASTTTTTSRRCRYRPWDCYN